MARERKYTPPTEDEMDYPAEFDARREGGFTALQEFFGEWVLDKTGASFKSAAAKEAFAEGVAAALWLRMPFQRAPETHEFNAEQKELRESELAEIDKEREAKANERAAARKAKEDEAAAKRAARGTSSKSAATEDEDEAPAKPARRGRAGAKAAAPAKPAGRPARGAAAAPAEKPARRPAASGSRRPARKARGAEADF